MLYYFLLNLILQDFFGLSKFKLFPYSFPFSIIAKHRLNVYFK